MNVTYTGVAGSEIVKFMRAQKVTIRELAKRMQIPLRAIRKVRATGTTFYGALDYWNGITGIRELPPDLMAMLKAIREAEAGAWYK